MINANQLREYVIRPTLKYLEPEIPYSEAAVELLMMTAAHESHLGTYIKQVKGPALGIYQMEPATHKDICDNFLRYNMGIKWLVEEISPSKDHNRLITDLRYSTAMARVHYYRVPEALPSEDNLEGLAKYAKKYFNTHLGKATWQDYYTAYTRHCL